MTTTFSVKNSEKKVNKFSFENLYALYLYLEDELLDKKLGEIMKKTNTNDVISEDKVFAKLKRKLGN